MDVIVAAGDSSLAQGYEALATADWERARDAFAAALEDAESPDALDGLGRALWWLRDARGAIVNRERAYAGFRRDGDLARAARIALWLAREYAVVFDNDAAARGWFARAERLLADVAPGAEQGWLDLSRSERAQATGEALDLAQRALDVALSSGDVDLELRALGRLGYVEVSVGRVDEGLVRLDEAMAVATSGEASTLETFADVSCTLMLACDLVGDDDRRQQWASVFEDFLRRYDHVTLLAFCRTCCADVYAAKGRIDAAEDELLSAIAELSAAGQRSRCIHPAARLAEIRVLQGRFDEAGILLAEYGDHGETVLAWVSLQLALGNADAAEERLVRRIGELGWSNLVAAPLLGRLAEARVAGDRLEAAAEAVSALDALAGSGPGRERVKAAAALARGRVALARHEPGAADALRAAINAYAALGLRLEASRARLELAKALVEASPGAAADVGRRAHDELQALGASREADAAAALVRSLGIKTGVGLRRDGVLTRREEQVLRLIGEGLSNQEIATRLFISPKTAGHHTSRIYAKLGLANRAAAAAYAATSLGRE
jgi:ATP/maltotriose-dependent transcriptional regulator MalT